MQAQDNARDRLREHTIEAVETGTVRSRYPRTVGRNARLGSHGRGGTEPVLRLRTDQGAQGWGLAAGRLDEVAGLLGANLADLIDPSCGVLTRAAVPADFALHDLAGQVLQEPVHRMLGGMGETSMTCYDGAIYFDDLDDPRGIEVVLENCARDRDLGYRAHKLKIGRGNRWMEPAAGRARDIEITRAVREAYPDADLLVDANDGYSAADFCRYLEAVADCRLFWVEEPFAETVEDLRLLRSCAALNGTLVADGEADPHVGDLLDLSAAGLLDVLLMDVQTFGFSAWRQAMPQLRERGVQGSPHAWGNPLKTLYAAQIAAGLGNVVTVEGVPGRMEGVDTGGYRLAEGVLTVPDTPGFGMALAADDMRAVPVDA